MFLLKFVLITFVFASVWHQDISKDFKELFEEWDNFQVINVYSESKCWRLVIRKRDDYHCATLEDGWQQLRADLGLIVGNTCVFESAIQCYDQFKIRVLDPEEVIWFFLCLMNICRCKKPILNPLPFMFWTMFHLKNFMSC